MSKFELCAVTLALCLWLAASDGSAAEPGPGCTLEAGPQRAVIDLIDAETLALDDGSEVRLIGALPPTSPKIGGGPEAWPPEREARSALEALVLGKSVELAFEKRRKDRYGRLLAHVFLNDDAGERIWLQGRLLSSGHARAYALPGLTACIAELRQHEAVAREAHLGLWSHAAYAERSALRTHELMRYRNTFQVVAGRIEGVTVSARTIYLNFGKDWRTDTTAALASAGIDAETKQRLQALAGKRVRVSGWIERRNGPYIEVFDVAQIETLEDRPLSSDSRFPPHERTRTQVRGHTVLPRP